MEKSVRCQMSDSFYLLQASVKMQEGKNFWVETSGGLRKAGKSFSCLIEPVVFDEVLITTNDKGKCYILAVLERNPETPSEVVFDGDTTLKVKDGDFHIGAHRVGLTGNTIDLASHDLSIHSVRGEAAILDFTFLGRIVKGNIRSMKIVAENVTNVVGRLVQRIRGSYRKVEDLEHVSAGRIRCIAEKSLFLKGMRSSLIAEKKVKIDAEKINLG
jgi:hypothetical protein